MGYYTTYELDIFGTDLQQLTGDELVAAVAALSENNEEISYIIDEEGYYTKWYNHDADMLDLSAKFPQYVLRLTGYGEETGDIWCNIYSNGELRASWALNTNIPNIKELLQSE